ncbi:hypothetical protein AHF37_12040 [Paragonimus kellicotti]|nr:hypothetical protein AHF37_12040 [Paragonimus kellicotti]
MACCVAIYVCRWLSSNDVDYQFRTCILTPWLLLPRFIRSSRIKSSRVPLGVKLLVVSDTLTEDLTLEFPVVTYAPPPSSKLEPQFELSDSIQPPSSRCYRRSDFNRLPPSIFVHSLLEVESQTR